MSFEPDSRLRFLDELIDQRANIAGDLVEVSLDSWAIHGTIPADGNVLLASFEQQRDAMAILHQLGPNVTDDGRQPVASFPTVQSHTSAVPADRGPPRTVRRVGDTDPGRPGAPSQRATPRRGPDPRAKRR